MEDYALDFSRSQDPSSGSASGVLATYALPMKVVRNLGVGHKQVFVQTNVEVALTSAGDTLDLDLVSDSVAALNVSLTVIKQALITIPALSAIGYTASAAIPPSDSYEEFLGIRYYARGSGAIETGTLTTWLTVEPGFRRHYPVGATV